MSNRPSATVPVRVRVPRAMREFALVPLLVVAALIALAAISIFADQVHGSLLTSLRESLGHYIGKQSASDILSAVATGLVTVTSITFSVLLLAVQQTASTLSPVVFDQFVRRRANQVYLGFFVGLALYSYLVMAAVQPDTPPIIGAFFATALTVVALSCLLFLVYSTIDQMRPDNVMRQLHDRAVRAHEREARLVARTRRRPESDAPVNAECLCDTFGYVESVSLSRLERALEEAERPGDEGAEIELCVAVGDEVVTGDVMARVRHRDPAVAERLAAAVRRSIEISPSPDIDFDATTAIGDISNIGWTSGSTSKHNPAIAQLAVHALRDLGARWLREQPRPAAHVLPVVYPDRDVDELLGALYSAVIVARESRQHHQAAKVLETYRFLLGFARGAHAVRIRRDIDEMQSELDKLPASPTVEEQRQRLMRTLNGASRTTGARV